MSNTDASSPEVRETTRERILRVAAGLFARNGFHGTGVAELGEAAGVGRGALYYQIGSKEQLLFDLSRRHVEEATAAAEAAISGHDDARAQLTAFTRSHLRILASRRAEVIVVERERHTLTGDYAVQLGGIHRRYRDLLTGILTRGVKQGHFAPFAEVDVMGALGLLSSTYSWLDPDGPISVDDVAERFSALLQHGLVAPR